MNALRLVLAMAGFAAAVLTVATDVRWIGWLAIALLAAAFLLRLLQRNPSREHRQDESDTT
jgi:membrane protein implicated in regulation of membrane protease activity